MPQSGLNRLTYYHFQISSHKLNKDSESKSGKVKSIFGWPEEGVANWVKKKAAETWAGFGKAQGGWKVCADPFLAETILEILRAHFL